MSFLRRTAGALGVMASRNRGGGGGPGAVPVIESVTPSGLGDELNQCAFAMPAVRPDGDLYVLHLARDDNEPFVQTGDINLWTMVHHVPNLSNNTAHFTLAWRIGAGEPANYVFPHTADTEWFVAHVLRISGANTADPVDVSALDRQNAGTEAVAPAVTVGFDNDLVLRVFQVDTQAFVVSAAGGAVQEVYRAGGGLNQQQGAAGYSEPGPAAGASTGTLAQPMPASDDWFAATLAIRAAGA